MAVNACTIVARNYLAHARVLATSFREHHPDGRLTVLVIDGDPARPPEDLAGAETITPGELDVPDFLHMATGYDVLELSTALKPWLLRHLLEGADHVVYLDPDIRIFASLEPVAAEARAHAIVLTPHSETAIPRDGLKPSESDILLSGAYNLGFIALGAGRIAEHVLRWWQDRLRTDCIVDVERGYFVDQRWIDLLPGLAGDHTLLRDPGSNLAYWNLHGRTLTRDGDAVLVNGEPLRFLHLSGYDPHAPDRMSRHQTRFALREDPVLAELFDGYRAALLEAGYDELIGVPYGYATTLGGLPLDQPLRRAWAIGVKDGQLERPVFDSEGEAEFLTWLTKPAAHGAQAGINRFMHVCYLGRPDLRQAFPALDDGDGPRFRQWFAAGGSQFPGAQRLAGEIAAPRPPLAIERPSPGVNLVGYLESEVGVGEAGRQVVGALDAAGVEVYPVGIVAPASRQGHPFATAEAADAPYPVNLLCVNADQTPGVVAALGEDFGRDRHTIGWWWWEVSDFPEEWTEVFRHVDEIWTGSRFVAEALARVAPVPVLRIPTPVAVDQGTPADRRGLGLPEDAFLFLFLFDFESVVERKNPLGAIAAFERAFPERDGRQKLVLKCVNGAGHPDASTRLREAAAGNPDIILLDVYLDAEQKDRLLASCDCYLSLHRSEGFGLTCAEAMLLAKPVIATRWSGSADYMDPAHSLPVRGELVPVGPGHGPYPPEGRWIEPDLDEAARHMRAVVEDPDLGRELGRRAAAFIAREHSPAAAGEAMRERLGVLAARAERTSPLDDPRLQLDAARGALHAGVPRSARSRLHPARVLRAVVLRLTRPRAEHQHRIDRILTDDVEEMTRALHGHMDARFAAARAAELRERRVVERLVRAYERTRPGGVLDHLAAIQSALDRLGIEQVAAELRAVPFTSRDVFTVREEPGAGRVLGLAEPGAGEPGGFADVFRGSEDFIRERQRAFLPLLEGAAPVLDVGCGRGELLDLLAERGIAHRGVDIDPECVAACRARGHDVEVGAAAAHLESLPPGSLGGVFSAQLVDQLAPDVLRHFLAAAARALRPGGVFIAETVNPHSIQALKTFWVDLDHRHPVFPEVLLHLTAAAGFGSAYVFCPNGTGDYERDRNEQGEYAVVARR